LCDLFVTCLSALKVDYSEYSLQLSIRKLRTLLYVTVIVELNVMIRHLAYHVYGCSVSGKGSCESYRRKVNIIKVCNLFCKPTKVDCIYIAIAVIPKILMPVWSYVGFARPVSIIQYAVLKECIKLSISTNHSIIFAQDRIRQQLSSLTMQTFRILLREV
jgi:hypothetical protein